MVSVKKISVGILLPSSSILPMGKDFENGLKKGLKELMSDETWEVELVPEFITQGAQKRVEEAISKLFSYDNVDVVTGIVSNRVASQVAERFEKSRKPFLLNNLGEHLPNPVNYNPFILLNSTHSWQQIWSLGNWAVKKFGKKGMFVGSVYESGYSFLNMLKIGMQAGAPDCTLSFSVAPATAPGKASDPRVVFDAIEQQAPDFICSIFCGEEAVVFQEEYIRRGLNIPLLGLPFLLESFNPEQGALEFYTAMSSYAALQPGQLNGEGMKQQNPFPSLGFESGRLIAEAAQKWNGKDLHEVLKTAAVDTGRGPLSIDAQRTGEQNRIYLVKNTHKGNRDEIERQVIEELPTITLTSPEIIATLKEIGSGWENPYLGI